MELVKFMTLAGLLFLIGVYGALTRRSFAGVLLSLAVSTAGLVLAFATFNRLIQPAETNGYFFGLVILMMSVVYGVFVAQFVRRGNPRKSGKTVSTDSAASGVFEEIPTSENDLPDNARAKAQVRFSRRESEGFPGLMTFSNSFAFQVAVLMIFVVGYLLMKLSLISALAFLFGVAVLSHMLHKRKTAREASHMKKQSGANPSAHAYSLTPTRTDEV